MAANPHHKHDLPFLRTAGCYMHADVGYVIRMHGCVSPLVAIKPEHEKFTLIALLRIGGVMKSKPQKQFLSLIGFFQLASQRVIAF